MKTLVTNLALFACAGLMMAHCGKTKAPVTAATLFDTVPQVRTLSPIVGEISGIADSRANPGYLWAQEDSGNPPQLYLIGHDGAVAKTIFLKNIPNRDWEDMALVNTDIYVGDIGDNTGSYNEYAFYRFPEPSFSQDTVREVETIRFTYPDGAHDAEAFIVDAKTKDIYIITKRDQPSAVYRIAYPYGPLNKASLVGQLPYSGVVSAAISSEGREIVVKTYLGIYYYTRKPGETIAQALKGKYISLAYRVEPQGEALSFAVDGSGLFTLSEKGFSSSVYLYFYKRH